MFTGGPGTGKSRAAAAVARGYRDLGLLPLGHAAEVASADLADTKPREAARLMDEAARPVPGGVLMITDVHAWHDLPDHGQQMLRCLDQLLTQVRDRVREDLAVILASQAGPLGVMLRASPALAAAFPRSSTSPAIPPTSSPPSSPPWQKRPGSRSLQLPPARPIPY